VKGRSAARNQATKQAAELHIDWLFFLDADDLLFANAFDLVQQYVNAYDAIWGTIVQLSKNFHKPVLRIPQIMTIESIQEILLFDPFLYCKSLLSGQLLNSIESEISGRRNLSSGESSQNSPIVPTS
jgi:glycosyltransferase involved in cell wall biosynthesis